MSDCSAKTAPTTLLRTSTLPGIAGVDHVLLGRNVPEAAVVVKVANFFRAILFAVIF